MKPIIRNWFNPAPHSERIEQPYGYPLTVPNQALPLKTLLERYVRGQEVHTFEPVFLGEDEEFVGVEHMTFDERHEYLLNVNASIALARAQMANRKSDPVVEDQIMQEAEVVESKPKSKTKSESND